MDDFNYHYNYNQGISYPHDYNVFQEEGHFLAKHKESGTNQLYSDNLLNLDRTTQANLRILKEKLIKQDPCYAFGMEHWHPGHRKQKVEGGTWDFEDLPPHARPKWGSTDVIFTDSKVVKKKGWTKPTTDKNGESSKKAPEVISKFCYLCTTLEEHKRHLARRGLQLKEKKKPKPRIEYIAPPPMVTKKKTEVEEKAEVMYKVTVRTAKRGDAGTSANVMLQIHGKRGSMKKRPLTRRRTGRFCFGSGTDEVFHFRGPDVGQLQYITIEHDGVEKSHSWLVQEVEILVAKTDGEEEVWIFPCGQWLSLHLSDFSIKRNLRAHRKEIIQTEYEVKVLTGKESHAGTDANVYLTVYGKKGSSKRFPLKSSEGQNSFAKGTEGVFHVVLDDIGPVSSIKIEHDNQGKNPSWLLEKVVMTSLEGTERTYTFPCGDWLSSNDEDGKTFRYLYPMGRKSPVTSSRVRGKKGSKDGGNLLNYEVKVLTGNLSYAGTDARVYLTMHGKLGRAQELELENGTDCFERGQTDRFHIRAQDVGDLKKVTIRHDNSGLGAGWFLEEMVVKRFFSKTEVIERLNAMEADIDEKVVKKASMAGIDIDSSPTHSKSLQHTGSVKRKDKRIKDSSDDEKHRRGKDGRRRSTYGKLEKEDKERSKKKKVFTYSGIKVVISETDTEESEDERKGKRGSSKKTKKSKSKRRDSSESSDSDSSDDDKKDKKYRKKKGKKSDSDSTDDDRKSKKHKKKKGKKNYDSDSSESDSEEDKYKRRKAKTHDTKSRRPSSRAALDDSDEEGVTTRWKEDRIPKYDEYIFECHRWLAEDEDDGQISRALKPKSITTHYKMGSK